MKHYEMMRIEKRKVKGFSTFKAWYETEDYEPIQLSICGVKQLSGHLYKALEPDVASNI
jgi:hypothetical protein